MNSRAASSSRKPLWRELLWPLAGLAALILALTFSIIVNVFEQNKSAAIAQLQAIADAKTQQITDWLKERERDAHLLQVSPFLGVAYLRWRQEGDLASRDRLTQRLVTFLNEGNFQRTVLLDVAGAPLWAADLAGEEKNPRIDPATRDRLLAAATSDRVSRLGPYRDEAGNIHLDFVFRLTLPNQQPGPIVILHSDTDDYLPAALRAWPLPSATGEALLFRPDDEHIQIISNVRFRPDAALNFRLPRANPRYLAVQAVRSPDQLGRVLEGMDYRGVEAVGVAHSVPGTDWYLMTKQDRGEIYADARNNAILIGTAGLLTLLMGCFTLVSLHQRRQLMIAAGVQLAQQERLRTLHALSSTADFVSRASGENFFREAVCHAAETLELDYVHVGRLLPGTQRIETLAAWLDGKIIDNWSYELAGTPCDYVVKMASCRIETNVQARYPDDVDLKNLGAESYVGEPMLRRDGGIIGLCVGVSRRPLQNDAMVESVLRILATRATAEWEQLEALQTLRERELTLRIAVAAARIGLYEWDIVTNQVLLSPEWKAQLGYPDDELPSSFASWRDNLHPDDRQRTLDEVMAFVAKPTTAFDMEYRMRHKDGSYRWIAAKGAPTLNDAGQAIRLTGGHIDISEFKYGEENLRKLAQAVEQSPESIVITNLDAEIEYVNAAFLQATGYSREEVIGLNPRTLQSGKTPKETYLSLWEALQHGHPWKGEFVNQRKDGSEYIEFAIITPLRQPDGTISHYVAVKEDVTEKKHLGQELDRHRDHLETLVAERTAQLEFALVKAESASRAKASFLANMSHEIRTPMNAILGMTHLVRRGEVSAKQNEQLDRIEQASRHLLGLINDILDLSKVEAGKLTLESVPLNVAGILPNIASLLGDQARDKGLQLNIEPGNLPENLCGDATRLTQALLNLASNAVKFTLRGQVTLRAQLLEEDTNGALIRFVVEDTGIGIPADILPRLFTAFEQADASTTRRYGGSGLGLAITRHLAELMGGKVGADSTPGVGSSFWFTARLAKCEVAATSTLVPVDRKHEAEALLKRHHAGVRVLLVEDDPINQEVAAGLLESVGLAPEMADDGAVAVRRVASGETFALILMDMQMPVMGGLEATRQIRRLANGTRIPILAMTANAFAEDRQRCLDAGMNDFIAKPADPEALFVTLLKWLPARTDTPDQTVKPTAIHAPAVSAPEHLPSQLAALDGPELQKALRVLGGDVARHVRMLCDFAARHGDDLAQIETLLAHRQWEAARHLAHAQKGAAGSLGLVRLQNAAAALDAALRQMPGEDQDPEASTHQLQPLMATLGRALKVLCGSVAGLPAATPVAADKNLDPVALRHLLDQLEILLSADDTAAVEVFAENRSIIQQSLGADAASLTRQIDAFDFSAALVILRKLRGSLPAKDA